MTAPPADEFPRTGSNRRVGARTQAHRQRQAGHWRQPGHQAMTGSQDVGRWRTPQHDRRCHRGSECPDRVENPGGQDLDRRKPDQRPDPAYSDQAAGWAVWRDVFVAATETTLLQTSAAIIRRPASTKRQHRRQNGNSMPRSPSRSPQSRRRLYCSGRIGSAKKKKGAARPRWAARPRCPGARPPRSARRKLHQAIRAKPEVQPCVAARTQGARADRGVDDEGSL